MRMDRIEGPSDLGDISHAHLCARCHHWTPDEATFCGWCGLQQRSTEAEIVAAQAAQQRAHRRRVRRIAAFGTYGWAGVLGHLIGEAARRQDDDDRR